MGEDPTAYSGEDEEGGNVNVELKLLVRFGLGWGCRRLFCSSLSSKSPGGGGTVVGRRTLRGGKENRLPKSDTSKGSIVLGLSVDPLDEVDAGFGESCSRLSN